MDHCGVEIILPPSKPPCVQYEPSVNDAGSWNIEKLENVSVEDVLRAVKKAFRKNGCCGLMRAKRELAKIQIDEIETFDSYKYKIITWTESRTSQLHIVPYIKQTFGSIDGPNIGNPPAIWSIPCEIPKAFSDEEFHIKVPHTEKIEKCSECSGIGCIAGMGHPQMKSASDESFRCKACNGSKKMKHFIQMDVKFQRHNDSYVYNKSGLSDDFIRKHAPSGRKIFGESTRRIGQIINFPKYDFNQNVACLVEQHKSNWPNEQIHFQSQKIISMPVIQVKYHSRRDPAENGQFWIFGDTREVLWTDMDYNLCPKKCSTCNIL